VLILKPSIVILTFNSELSIAETLKSVATISDDTHIVDSFSRDRTLEIAQSFNANIVQHPFESYGAQRNWSIDSLRFKYGWQLHLDADERLTPELCQEILQLGDESEISGYYLPRRIQFLGRPIRHGGLCPTWHMRLFRSGSGRCEARKYDQHFYVTSGKTRQLNGYMIDDLRMSLTEWTARHNRWAEAEVEELTSAVEPKNIRGKIAGSPVERKRFLRGIYNGFPLFVRPFGLFFYRYFVRLGFLDGPTGLIFYILQTFWFRFLIDAKLFEKRQEHASDAQGAAVAKVDLPASAGTKGTSPACQSKPPVMKEREASIFS
jgi:glycosyltransferase involved in cell wall biosynthesis